MAESNTIIPFPFLQKRYQAFFLVVTAILRVCPSLRLPSVAGHHSIYACLSLSRPDIKKERRDGCRACLEGMTCQRSPLCQHSITAMEAEKVRYFVDPSELSRVDETVALFFPSFAKLTEEKKEGILNQTEGIIPYAWIHKPSQNNRQVQDKALVCSCLSGIDVLENKSNFAALTKHMAAPGSSLFLESFSVKGVPNLRRWCETRFEGGSEPGCDSWRSVQHGAQATAPSWIVKDAGGNGGEGLFVLSQENWQKVVSCVDAYTLGITEVQQVAQRHEELAQAQATGNGMGSAGQLGVRDKNQTHAQTEQQLTKQFVIQRYVQSPMLHNDS